MPSCITTTTKDRISATETKDADPGKRSNDLSDKKVKKTIYVSDSDGWVRVSISTKKIIESSRNKSDLLKNSENNFGCVFLF